MKILYADMLWDYCKKERGLNLIGQNGFLKSLKSVCGKTAEIFEFYYDEYLEKPELLQQKIREFADDIRPDLIFHPTYIDQFDFETLDYLKSKYTTIAWFGDDTWRFDNYTKDFAPHYTWCVTTDRHSVKKYKAIGQNNVILSQWAAIDTDEKPEFDGYRYDVSFVGGHSPEREWFINELEKYGIKTAVFGHGWKNGAVSEQEMNKILIASKINLNLSNSFGYDFRYIYPEYEKVKFDFFSRLKHGFKIIKRYKKCSGKLKNKEQMKARHFEIPYFNGFQLSYFYPGMFNENLSP
jgi:spore maturation protein CgeB